MSTDTKGLTELEKHAVWDRTTRWFHWINALCVLGLAVFGLAILNAGAFGVGSEGKILLKTLHVYIGYAFAINLSWRLIWAFVGSPGARWRAILPFRKGFLKELFGFLRRDPTHAKPAYRGHNPLGRMMVTLLLALLFIQAATGLVLAGTDLYKPPFGHWIADWVTAGDPERLAGLTPGSKEDVDPASYDSMRAFRKPIVTTHLYTFYVLMAAGLLHIAGVVTTELRERSGVISAMITGEKVIRGEPRDSEH